MKQFNKLLKMKSLFAILLVVILGGCSTAYYNAMEKVGVHKRDIMVDRVEAARDSQVEAKETFKSALDQFQKTLKLDNTALKDKYETINEEYESAKKAADDVSGRIEKIENVAEALFDEWKDELAQYSSASLRQKSQQQYDQTRVKYKKLVQAMHRAEKKMDPVLSALNDQVLYLKHNLNAQAISSMKGELSTIQGNVSKLITEMEKSIAESNSFIQQLEASK